MIAVNLVEILICVFMIVFVESDTNLQTDYPLTKHLLAAAFAIFAFWQIFSIGVFEFLSDSRRADKEEEDFKKELRGNRTWRRDRQPTSRRRGDDDEDEE